MNESQILAYSFGTRPINDAYFDSQNIAKLV